MDDDTHHDAEPETPADRINPPSSELHGPTTTSLLCESQALADGVAGQSQDAACAGVR